MNDTNGKTAGWKRKFVREMAEYCVNFMYLAFFFGLFTWYRRFVLAEYGISYLHYGVSLIEALVLAKVILVGNVLRLGRGLEEKPLIFPTLYKAVVFGVWVAGFGIAEQTISGILHGKGMAGGIDVIIGRGRDELLARCLVTLFAFIPFFAVKELGRVLGEGKILELFFKRRGAGIGPEQS